MLDRIAEWLGAFTARRSGLILVVAAGVALLSVAAAARLRLNPELLAFLPAGNRAVADFRRVVEALGTIDHHLVMITVPRGADGDEVEALVERVALEYQRLPEVEAVEWRLPEIETLVDAALPRLLLLLTPRELDLVRTRLSDAAIAEAMARNRMILQTPQSNAAEQLLRADPLALHHVVLQRMHSLTGGLRLDPTSRFLRSSDGAMYLIVVRPKRPAHDLPFADRVMARANEIERHAPGLRFDYAGGYAITHADARLIRADMIVNVLFSVTGVLLLFVLAFRRLRAIVYAAVPMLLAIVTTFGVAALALGELGAASAGFAALLAGLGIDFTTVLYERFVEERRRGTTVGPALRETLRSTFPGVVAAAVTTAATFYGLLFTDFRGMAQMGFLTGTGILLFLAAVAFVFPALATRLERDEEPAPRSHVHFLGVAPLVRWSVRKPRLTIALWTVVVVVMAVAAQGIVFTDDAGRLRARGNSAIAAQERLSATFGRGGDAVMIVAEAPTADEALAISEKVLPALERLSARGAIGGIESASWFPPSRARQEQTLAALRRDGAFDVARIEASFRRAAIENGFRSETWDRHLAQLAAGLTPSRPVDWSTEPTALAPLLARFLGKHGTRWMSVIYIHPPRGRWVDGVPPSLRSVAASDGRLTLTGVTVVSAELRRITLADARRATLIGTAMVVLILLVTFGSPLDVLLIFVPFGAGTACMLGTMAVLRLELNLMNIFIGLMLVGVATDYAVYLLQRYRENPDRFTRDAPETGKALAMAAATSIVGYGSFALSRYPGLQSIGYAAAFGIGASCLAALTLLPAILVAVRSRRR